MTGSRADEFTRVKVKLSALIASLDETVARTRDSDSEFDQGAGHASAVTARELRAILNETALNTTSAEPVSDRQGVIVTITPDGLVHGITIDGTDVGRHVPVDSLALTATCNGQPLVQLAIEADHILIKPKEKP